MQKNRRNRNNMIVVGMDGPLLLCFVYVIAGVILPSLTACVVALELPSELSCFINVSYCRHSSSPTTMSNMFRQVLPCAILFDTWLRDIHHPPAGSMRLDWL
jgi:hypothetical protein